eukprot:12402034-Karenia_brevis.AAC.1
MAALKLITSSFVSHVEMAAMKVITSPQFRLACSNCCTEADNVATILSRRSEIAALKLIT